MADMLTLSRDMEEVIADLRHEGQEAAEADRVYRLEKAKKIAELKAGGWPATITEAMANGHLIVADARCKRELNDALRDASKELLNLKKRQYDFLRDTWRREWGAA
jgi:hypothetical protein